MLRMLSFILAHMETKRLYKKNQPILNFSKDNAAPMAPPLPEELLAAGGHYKR